MIAAGLVLLAIGTADVVREFLPAARRWIGLLVVAIAILAIGAFSGAPAAALLAVAAGAAWVWLAPVGAPGRAGFWPAVTLAALCAVLVAAIPARTDAGLIGLVWNLPSPVGPLSFDHAVLLVGTTVFLLESANVIVRAALTQEHVQVGRSPIDPAGGAAGEVEAADPAAGEPLGGPAGAPDATADAPVAAPEYAIADAEPGYVLADAEPSLKGGRLIGPLERLIVFALTLAAIYPLLAAILAAKGIVRFPEISRDSVRGNRAEYFLIGSFVSWTVALAAAFLVWWAFASSGP